jgi:putative peptidoglycan lipid II flippase
VSSDDQDDAELRRGSSLVALGILGSRLTGLLREIATARFLGTGPGAEAFKAALRIPNLLQNLLGEGVLSASFVPVYSRMVADGREEDAGRLAGAIAGLLVAVTTVIVLVAVVFARPITRVIAWGFEPGGDRFELTVTLVRIITPGVGLLVLSAWCLGILNSHRRFFLSYIAPVLWNAAIISALVGAALLVTTEEAGLATAMGFGALVGSVLQFLVQLPTVRRLVPHLRVSLSRDQPGVRTVLGRFGQVLAGRGSVQLGSYVDLFAASLLAVGGVAAVTYAQSLYLLPIALFGMSVAAAELPALSTMDHTDRHRIVARLDAGLGRVAFFVLPTTVAFIVAGNMIVTLLFQGNRFSAAASVQVGTILSVYAFGMLASTESRLLQSVLYGSGDARTPAIYAAIRVVASAIVGIGLMLPLDAIQAGVEGFTVVGDFDWSIASVAERQASENLLRMGGAGVAIGGAFGAWCELGLLRIRVRILYGPTRILGRHARPLLVATGVAALMGLAARWWVASIGVPARIDAVVVLGVIGVTYLAVTRLQGVPDAKDLLRRVNLG